MTPKTTPSTMPSRVLHLASAGRTITGDERLGGVNVAVQLLGGDVGAPADLDQGDGARLCALVERDRVTAEQRGGHCDRPQLAVSRGSSTDSRGVGSDMGGLLGKEASERGSTGCDQMGESSRSPVHDP